MCPTLPPFPFLVTVPCSPTAARALFKLSDFFFHCLTFCAHRLAARPVLYMQLRGILAHDGTVIGISLNCRAGLEVVLFARGGSFSTSRFRIIFS
jgi:hypothetical protein